MSEHLSDVQLASLIEKLSAPDDATNHTNGSER